MEISSRQLQKHLLAWFDQHGRKHLPWQQNKTPYRVWISEIMLQQTQVSTVIPYFERFMRELPTLQALANATDDTVLHLWAGLGYYSRARNLHRAAKMIMTDFHGKFPDTLADLQTLPGIGPSTAGAILSIAYNQPTTILDGNVKRVLTRLHGITSPINEKATTDALWALAKQYTPTKRVADYTQAIMDLGATLCVRGKPECALCPLIQFCSAHQQGIAHLLPHKKSARALPTRSATFLLLQHDQRVLLCKRPPVGIWGGLWSLPEIAGQPEKKAIRSFCQQQFNISITDYQTLESFRHTFSHYHLDIFPVLITVKKMPTRIMEAAQQIWYNPNKPESVGLPKPVQLLMRAIT